MLVKEKWFITFIWHAIALTFVIYFDILFDFEIKKKRKKVYLLQEEKKKKKEKKFDTRPPGIEPGSTDSESNELTVETS